MPSTARDSLAALTLIEVLGLRSAHTVSDVGAGAGAGGRTALLCDLAGFPVNLNAESLGVAAGAADVMLTARLFSPLPAATPPMATYPILTEETDVPGL